MSVGTVRWRAVRPLAICGALGLGAWILFADRVAKHAVESVGTTLIGASVEIRRLHLDLPHGRVEVRGLTVASPFAALQNLLEADELVADVDPLPLLEKKVVIDRLAAKGLRFGTPRQTDGRTVGQSDGVRGQVERWTAQLHVPVLQFATGKIDVGQLDLSTLSTPAAAQSLAAQVDSVRTAKQMTDRLRGAKPTAGQGTVSLSLALVGDSVQARWSMRSERVHWVRDSATARSQLGDIVWRVVSGVSMVDVSASLGGTLARPRLAVGSNLDGVLAQRIRALAGEASAGAERQLRARADSLAERQAAPVRAQVATLTTEVTQRLSGQQALLDQAQRALEQRLRELTTIPGVRLP